MRRRLLLRLRLLLLRYLLRYLPLLRCLPLLLRLRLLRRLRLRRLRDRLVKLRGGGMLRGGVLWRAGSRRPGGTPRGSRSLARGLRARARLHAAVKVTARPRHVRRDRPTAAAWRRRGRLRFSPGGLAGRGLALIAGYCADQRTQWLSDQA